MSSTLFRITRAPFHGPDQLEMRIALKSHDGRIAVVDEIRMRQLPEDGEPICREDDAPLRLSRDDAARLMDELWNAGVRPTEQGSPAQIAAMAHHLEDMRCLVFKKEPK